MRNDRIKNTINEKILWPEDNTEDDELTFHHIQHKKWFFINFYKRKDKKNGQVKYTEYRSQTIKPSLWFFGINIIPPAFIADGSNRISERSPLVKFNSSFHSFSF